MAKRRGRASKENGGPTSPKLRGASKITAGQFAELSGLAIPQLWKVVRDMDTGTAQEWIQSPARLGSVLVSAFRHALMPTQTAPILPIPRSRPFNPARFIGDGWSIWKGPADGDGFSGAEDQDERSLALTKLDLSQVQLVTCLKDGEASTTGEERIKRLKAANYICLDAQILQTLWENQRLIPESWKEKTNRYITYIFFDGTPLRGPDGHRDVLCLCRRDGGWGWGCGWLEGVRRVNNPSAVLIP